MEKTNWQEKRDSLREQKKNTYRKYFDIVQSLLRLELPSDKFDSLLDQVGVNGEARVALKHAASFVDKYSRTSERVIGHLKSFARKEDSEQITPQDLGAAFYILVMQKRPKGEVELTQKAGAFLLKLSDRQDLEDFYLGYKTRGAIPDLETTAINNVKDTAGFFALIDLPVFGYQPVAVYYDYEDEQSNQEVRDHEFNHYVDHIVLMKDAKASQEAALSSSIKPVDAINVMIQKNSEGDLPEPEMLFSVKEALKLLESSYLKILKSEILVDAGATNSFDYAAFLSESTFYSPYEDITIPNPDGSAFSVIKESQEKIKVIIERLAEFLKKLEETLRQQGKWETELPVILTLLKAEPIQLWERRLKALYGRDEKVRDESSEQTEKPKQNKVLQLFDTIGKVLQGPWGKKEQSRAS